MNLSTFGQAVREVLSHPEYTQVLGFYFVLALVIGSILSEQRRLLYHWTLAIIFVAIGNEYTRFIYWNHVRAPEIQIMTGTAVTTISTFFYILGIALGWAIARGAKRNARMAILKERSKRVELFKEINSGESIKKP